MLCAHSLTPVALRRAAWALALRPVARGSSNLSSACSYWYSPFLWPGELKRAVADHLVGVHVGRRAGAALITAWKTRNAVLYERFRQVLTDLRASESPDLAMLSV